MAFRLHVPKLLQADGVVLRGRVLGEAKLGHEFLAEMPATALGEQRVLGAQLVARLEHRLALAVRVHAHVLGGNAPHRTVVAVENLGRGKARKHVHAQLFRLGAEPTAEIAERKRIVARVLALARNRPHGQQDAVGVVDEKVEAVVGDWVVERRTVRRRVGKQFVQRLRRQHRAGEDVCADLGALLHEADGKLAPGIVA